MNLKKRLNILLFPWLVQLPHSFDIGLEKQTICNQVTLNDLFWFYHTLGVIYRNGKVKAGNLFVPEDPLSNLLIREHINQRTPFWI